MDVIAEGLGPLIYIQARDEDYKHVENFVGYYSPLSSLTEQDPTQPNHQLCRSTNRRLPNIHPLLSTWLSEPGHWHLYWPDACLCLPRTLSRPLSVQIRIQEHIVRLFIETERDINVVIQSRVDWAERHPVLPACRSLVCEVGQPENWYWKP